MLAQPWLSSNRASPKEIALPEVDEARRDTSALSRNGSDDVTDEGFCVRLEGELDMATSDALEHAVDHAESATGGLIVLDLASVTFMDTSGLRVLLRAWHRANGAGHTLQLVNVPRAVRRLMLITNNERLLSSTGAIDSLA
jgi:anti-sigma B factor antagonist